MPHTRWRYHTLECHVRLPRTTIETSYEYTLYQCLYLLVLAWFRLVYSYQDIVRDNVARRRLDAYPSLVANHAPLRLRQVAPNSATLPIQPYASRTRDGGTSSAHAIDGHTTNSEPIASRMTRHDQPIAVCSTHTHEQNTCIAIPAMQLKEHLHTPYGRQSH